jgi:hypothetical protein
MAAFLAAAKSFAAVSVVDGGQTYSSTMTPYILTNSPNVVWNGNPRTWS